MSGTGTCSTGDRIDSTVSADSLVGQKFGNYVLDELIGEGALSKVYRAHPEGLDKTSVALKVIKEGMNIERFKTEAQRLDGLDHPNVIKILGANFEHSPSYLVLEHGGRSLRKEIQERAKDFGVVAARYNWQKAAGIVLDVLKGMKYTHARKLYHGDIKPENILVKDNVVKISDFNLATATTAVTTLEDAIRHSVTATRMSVRGDEVFLNGTPGYASPEQQDGKSPSEKGDVFSTGVLLYELLTGHLPRGSYTPPSEQGAPKWLDKVVNDALNPEAEKRSSIEDFTAVLTKGLAGEFDKKTNAEPGKMSRFWQNYAKPFLSNYAKPAAYLTAAVGLFPLYAPVWATGKLIKWESDNPYNSPFGCFGSVATWFAYAFLAYNSISFVAGYSDSTRLEQELKENGESGRIAYVRDGNINYIDANDILSENPEIHTIYANSSILEMLWTHDQNIVYLGHLFNASRNGIHFVNTTTGEVNKIFTLDDFSSEDSEFADLNSGYDIDDIAVGGTRDDCRIFFKVRNNFYSINNAGEDLRREHMVSSSLETEQTVCPHGTHVLNEGIFLGTSIEQKDGWGSVTLPVVWSLPAWYHPPD
ncbi:MAG: serine/threonine protein kinase [Candidatus Aenigmarchaeota archaeon]|nr:serine/threonine protein kinase [Candidatus Aenigmarchaeota archaeon]